MAQSGGTTHMFDLFLRPAILRWPRVKMVSNPSGGRFFGRTDWSNGRYGVEGWRFLGNEGGGSKVFLGKGNLALVKILHC